MPAVKMLRLGRSMFLEPMRAHRSRVLSAIGLLWLVCVLAGMGFLWQHSYAAGELDAPPPIWPTDSALPHRNGRATLVFFAHPHCPCTLASLRELDRLLAHTSQPLDALVVFVKPKGVDENWTDTSVWALADGIAGVLPYVDDGGREGKRFAAKTSGQVCLYDAQNRLLFHGGITSARGHEGDNLGRSAIQSHLNGQPAQSCSPVFGCSLYAPPATTKAGG